MEQATNGNNALALVKPQQTLANWDTEENLALLRQTYAKDLNNAEFSLYVEHCRQLRLNPLTKQVQPIKFDGKTLIFHTTIHGLIAIAARSGTYAGMDDVKFDVTPKGDTLNGQHPHSATVTAYKLVGGQRCPITTTVYWVEKNRNQASWKTQPFAMLAKCARADVIRLGWEETLGMYIEEELFLENGQVVESKPARVVNQPPADQEPPLAPPAGESWKSWCEQLGKRLGIFDTLKDYLDCFQNVTSVNPRQKGDIPVPTWQKWAHYLLNEISLVEEQKRSDATTAVVDVDEGEDDAGSSN